MERKEKKIRTGSVEDQNGLLPIFGSLSQQRILYRDKEFWPCVATWLPVLRHGPQARRTIAQLRCTRNRVSWPCVSTVVLCRDRFWPGTGFLCRDKEFLVATEPPGSMSRHSVLCRNSRTWCRVATKSWAKRQPRARLGVLARAHQRQYYAHNRADRVRPCVQQHATTRTTTRSTLARQARQSNSVTTNLSNSQK